MQCSCAYSLYALNYVFKGIAERTAWLLCGGKLLEDFIYVRRHHHGCRR